MKRRRVNGRRESRSENTDFFNSDVSQFQILPHRPGWWTPRADWLRIGLIDLVGLALPRPRQAIDHRVSTGRVFSRVYLQRMRKIKWRCKSLFGHSSAVIMTYSGRFLTMVKVVGESVI